MMWDYLKEIFKAYSEGIFIASTWIIMLLVCVMFWISVFNFVKGIL